jgi:hypothetical protein
MSILAHATYGALKFTAQKRNLDRRIQDEIQQALALQQQTGCSWSEALRLAYGNTEKR